jgi:hypothetical protein
VPLAARRIDFHFRCGGRIGAFGRFTGHGSPQFRRWPPVVEPCACLESSFHPLALEEDELAAGGATARFQTRKDVLPR